MHSSMKRWWVGQRVARESIGVLVFLCRPWHCNLSHCKWSIHKPMWPNKFFSSESQHSALWPVTTVGWWTLKRGWSFCTAPKQWFTSAQIPWSSLLQSNRDHHRQWLSQGRCHDVGQQHWDDDCWPISIYEHDPTASTFAAPLASVQDGGCPQIKEAGTVPGWVAGHISEPRWHTHTIKT